MTIEDQIRDEKLQYDINREAAKISALSSGKIEKYEYLTGEEQAKLTYSPLGKAFEKQTKAIEDQGKKQIDALADLKPKEIKQRETKPKKSSDYFIDEMAKIRQSYEPVDFNDLKYNFKNSSIPSVSFIKFKGPLHNFKNIHNGDIPLENIEKEQIELKRDLGRIKQGDPKNNLKQQEKTINNTDNLYNSREEVFLIIILRTCLKIFMIQNKEQELKY